ncbi:UDP binding domain-containing protein, partial [Vibrio cholerae]|uniref:UDP binding domain-containing protein n=1 Tax=Vibrio cholerae TaxID=666 RepID=UPI00181BEB4B
DDLRESPSLSIARQLVADRPDVNFEIIEPYVSNLPGDLLGFDNVNLVSIGDLRVSGSDLVVVLVGHKQFDALTFELESHPAVLDF